ncbi:MAG TPA: hypothetical protein VMV47_19405 [Bacteroidales bacterium]|nr:hypothetical protein [Bacteroidales bacterium]HUX97908.1 hypothetical protein [Bacteroidales bacterium]
MKVLLSFLTVIFIFLITSCREQPDSLDEIKLFHPDDKYFKSSMVSLHFIIETSSIDRVDSIFYQMINQYDLPVDAKGAKDGTYKGESPYDAFDYKHIVEMEIKDEKIVSLDYNEIHKNGIGKEEDESYCKEMSVTGTSPDIAYPLMEAEMLEKQNTMKVSAVSGATYSLYRFRYAITVALMKSPVK